MLDELTEDHHHLVQLCWFRRTPQVVDVLVAVASRHLAAEAQYFYPTVRRILPEAGVHEHLAADRELLRALRERRFDAVRDLVDAHVGRQERLFPQLRDACGAYDLIRLGNRVRIARESAPTRPHPGTPATPPLNKFVDPAIGVLDKLRDAFTLRTTWPEDLAHIERCLPTTPRR